MSDYLQKLVQVACFADQAATQESRELIESLKWAIQEASRYIIHDDDSDHDDEDEDSSLSEGSDDVAPDWIDFSARSDHVEDLVKSLAGTVECLSSLLSTVEQACSPPMHHVHH